MTSPNKPDAPVKDVVQAPTGERPDDPWEGAPPPTEQLEDNAEATPPPPPRATSA